MTTAKPGKSPLKSAGLQATEPPLPRGDEKKSRIIDNLTTTLIAVPLLRMMEKEPARSTKAYDLIIDLNLSNAEGRDAARQWVLSTLQEILAKRKPAARSTLGVHDKSKYSSQYLFARLDAAAIRKLALRNSQDAPQPDNQQRQRQRRIFRIWPDFPLHTLINKSIGTVKADAGRITFSAAGENIVSSICCSLLPPPNSKDSESPREFFELAGDDLIDRLGKPLAARGAAVVHAGGAAGGAPGRAPPGAGGAAGLGELFGGLLAGARNLLNYTTCYQIKERAGTIGRDGLNPQLRTLGKQFPQVKIYLIGHSFGGRLMAASAAGSDRQSSFGPASLTLLQAAFSHLGFAQDYDGKKSDGLFRRVLADRMVSGPVLVTCTGNDKAVGVGVMYAIASRLKNQVASGAGNKNDLYGGIGRNRAQTTPEASDATLIGVGGHYQFESSRLYNLNADAVINNHSDICKKEVAYALLSAVATA